MQPTKPVGLLRLALSPRSERANSGGRASQLIVRAFAVAGKKTPFTHEQLRKLLEPTVCSPHRAEVELGAKCHVDLEEAIADEARWLRKTGALPR